MTPSGKFREKDAVSAEGKSFTKNN